jgi:hypothetical protein
VFTSSRSHRAPRKFNSFIECLKDCDFVTNVSVSNFSSCRNRPGFRVEIVGYDSSKKSYPIKIRGGGFIQHVYAKIDYPARELFLRRFISLYQR